MSAKLTIVHSEDSLALDEYFFILAKRAIESGKRSIAILPSQATFSTERRILEQCNTPGIMLLSVMSMEKLAQNVLEKTAGRALKRLDSVSMAMLVKRELIKLRGKLSFPEGADPDLHVKIASLITALKSEDITPEKLKDLQLQGILAAKTRDIAMIYEQVKKYEGMDSADVLAYVAKTIPDAHWLADSNIMVFGFDVFTKVQTDIILALSEIANVVCAFNTRGVHSANALKRLANLRPQSTIRQIPPSRDRNEEISHIYAHFGDYPAVLYDKTPLHLHMHTCKNERAEVQTVAARILELHCKHGVDMADMAVVAANPTSYRTHIADVFGRCGIPYFLEGKRKLSESPTGVFVASALQLCIRPTKHELLRLMGTGLTDATHEQVQMIYAVVKSRGFRANSLLKPLPEHHADFEPLRIIAFERTARFLDEMKSTHDRAQTLLRYLEDMRIPQKLQELSEQLVEANLAEQGRFIAATHERFAELLENSQDFLKEVDMRTFSQMILAGMDSVDIAVVPPRNDEVTIGDLTHSIIPRKKAMFVLGVNDSVLPPVPSPDALIGENETAILRELLPTFPSKLSIEDTKSYIFKTFTCTGELTLTFNEKLPPSYLIRRLSAMFVQGEILGGRVPVNMRGALPALALELSGLPAGQHTILLPSYLHDKRSHELLTNLLPHVNAQNKPVALAKNTARELYGTLRSSVSEIENRYSCAYKHFLDYGIRPCEPKEYEEDAMSAGSYVHALLDGFSKKLGKRDVRSMSDAALENIVNDAAQEIVEEHNGGIFTEDSRAAFAEGRLRREVYFATRAIREQLKGTDVGIAASEKGFGFAGELRLDTRQGKVVIRGKIDRIDVVRSGNETFVRVVDYKTGSKNFSLSELYYGLNIQLMVYLLALRNMYRARGIEALPAGGFYFGIKLPIIDYGVEEDARIEQYDMSGFVLREDALIDKLTPDAGQGCSGMSIRMLKNGGYSGNAYSREEISSLLQFTETLIARAVEGIYDGDVAINPNPNGKYLPCKYCGYRSICRFDGDVQKEANKVTLSDFQDVHP